MTITEVVGIAIALLGSFSAIVGLVLMPANRKKIIAETKHEIAEQEKTEAITRGELQRQLNEIVAENERLRKQRADDADAREKELAELKEQREKDYQSREKERDAKKKEHDVLQDRLSNFESRHIQMLTELQVQQANSRLNQAKISALELQSEKDKAEREKDAIVIQQLKEEVRRLSSVTGKLEANNI